MSGAGGEFWDYSFLFWNGGHFLKEYWGWQWNDDRATWFRENNQGQVLFFFSRNGDPKVFDKVLQGADLVFKGADV